jgi:hypothetical protein
MICGKLSHFIHQECELLGDVVRPTRTWIRRANRVWHQTTIPYG